MVRAWKLYRLLWKIRNNLSYHNSFKIKDLKELNIDKESYLGWADGTGLGYYYTDYRPKEEFKYRFWISNKGLIEVSFWTWLARLAPIMIIFFALLNLYLNHHYYYK